jgi:Flp pilus assembly protein TadG
MTKGLCCDKRGATAIEFALIAPALFLTLFGAIEFGRLMWTQSALHYAVQQAARCASVNTVTCGTASQIASYAAGTVSALNIASSAFTATSQSCGHQVLASLDYQFVATGLFPYTPTLTAKACFP